MEHFLFDQQSFIREQTLKLADSVSEELADQIPDGFRNSIRWNLGHIYVVWERHAFQYIGEPLEVPDGYRELFEYNTTPLTQPADIPVPSLEEIKGYLRAQPVRMKAILSDRLQEKIEPPYTTSAGMTLASPEQFLSFGLYHEGMHQSVIKLYQKLLTL
ncbi:DinB family protein [Metabacillus sp. GX 13764]|uniref:DinB family protein n=1 Tax=Metabacillus kandeliae TaxID=2900151 RepID=UPI001E3CC2BB|nr:DinB family protein [Metabacillus kandeliae]MCD7034375.1 DinB family protein [Metabacillus kandeliae]